MWDERYCAEDYAYGTEPNDFLRDRFHCIPNGRVLSLAEGEGRNAVFLAKQGYAVTAIDASIEGIKKGMKLAEKKGVEVEFIHADLVEYDFGENQWDGIISIFFPLPSALREVVYRKVTKGLKRQGVFLLEAYTPEQLQFGTGGGNEVALMQSKQSLANELKGVNFDYLVELERDVIEGKYHTGMSSVVQMIATKV